MTVFGCKQKKVSMIILSKWEYIVRQSETSRFDRKRRTGLRTGIIQEETCLGTIFGLN